MIYYMSFGNGNELVIPMLSETAEELTVWNFGFSVVQSVPGRTEYCLYLYSLNR